MKLALFSDIHGNPIALDAVLHDIQDQGGVDSYWVLGDLVAQGFDPATVLQRLTTLPNVHVVRGNTDNYALMGERAYPSIPDAQSNPALIPTLVGVAQGFAWTHGYLAATGWIDWLAALPVELRMTLPCGTRVLGVHAAPGRDDGPGFEPSMREEELFSLLNGCEADFVCVGHTHSQHEWHIGDVHVVNVGNVSNPRRDAVDRRASYALLEADTSGYRLSLHQVAYDTQAVVHAIQEHHVFPNPEWLIGKFADLFRHSGSPEV